MQVTWSSHTGSKYLSHDLQKKVTGSSHAGYMTPFVPGVSNSSRPTNVTGGEARDGDGDGDGG